jgi:hypothetical protein
VVIGLAAFGQPAMAVQGPVFPATPPIPPVPPGLELAAPAPLDIDLSPADLARPGAAASFDSTVPPFRPGPRAGASSGVPFHVDLPATDRLTLSPTLRFNSVTSNANDVRIAPPQTQFDPTPGVSADMALDPDTTLGTEFNQPLRRPDQTVAPDGRPATAVPNFGVDLKMKF